MRTGESDIGPSVASRTTDSPQVPRGIAVFRRTFSSLADPTYRVLWIGSMLQMGGMQVTMFAQGFYVFELTGSAARLGIASAAMVSGAPFVLLGGVLADRLNKKRLIQWGQVASMLVVLFVAVSISLGVVTWHYLVIASAAQGLVMPFMMPARQSIIPQLVPQERLMNAIALNATAMSLTTMIAPGLAGAIVYVLGIEVLYYVIVGMYAGAVFATSFVPSIPPEPRRARSVLKELGAGIGYIRSHSVVLFLLGLGFVQVLFMMPIRNIMPVFASAVYGVGPEGLGVMMSVMGVGSLFGSLFVASLRQGGRRGLMLLLSGILSAAVVMGFSVASQLFALFALALVLLFLMGVIQAGRMAMQNTLVMESVENAYRGRVISFNMLGFGLMPLGVLPLGLLADRTGAPVALAIMAATFLTIVVIFLVMAPALRRVR